jgi:23S rRNA (pseudouridine1915-N3)-methyltransferase
MRIVLAAVGRLKDGAERALFERYWERLQAAGRPIGLGPLSLVEITEGRSSDRSKRKADEAGRLLSAAGGAGTAAFLVALDEGGKAISSAAFADLVRKTRDSGAKTMSLVIGGPDGHGAEALAAAQLRLSLGPMTLPHGLARIVLAEQLYRAATLIAGHPYHRA